MKMKRNDFLYSATLAAGATALPGHADEVVIKCYFDWSCDINRKCQDADLDIRFRADAETNVVKRMLCFNLICKKVRFKI